MHALHVQICTKTTYKYILSHRWPLFQCFLHVQICFLSLQIQAVTMPDVGCQSSPSQALKSREIGQASARGRAHFTGGASTVCRKNRGPSVLHCAFNLLLELSMLQSPEEPTRCLNSQVSSLILFAHLRAHGNLALQLVQSANSWLF